MDNGNDEDYALVYDDGDYEDSTNEVGDSQTLSEEETDNDVSHIAPDNEFQITDSSSQEPGPRSPTTASPNLAALASRMLQLSGMLHRRAQHSRAVNEPPPPSLSTPLPSSRRSLANQSADSFTSAGGTSVAPTPACLQPPPSRGRRARKTGTTSTTRKPKDPDNVPRTITYPPSSELEQRPKVGKETNSNQILRVEANIVRVEQLTQRLVGEMHSSMLSALATHRCEILKDTRAELDKIISNFLREEITNIVSMELNHLEPNLVTRLTSLLAIDTINVLLSSMEDMLNASTPVTAPHGPSPLHLPSRPKFAPSKPAPYSPQIPPSSPLPSSPSLLAHLRNGPSTMQPGPSIPAYNSPSTNVGAPQTAVGSSIKAGKRRADDVDANNRDPKHHRYDARSAHTVTIDLPPNWEPLPTTIDYIFDMYNTWSTDFDAAARVLLPRKALRSSSPLGIPTTPPYLA
ncbi:hypothetical protein F5876DRAFT_80874 [Lentinula aff. lateritia]|uniref:Uncharacterized protein n=1 Tax=Lentinula aff. lateritia TaxID=2804960 RepID=A0ACC1TNH5_9AGAR|nr:hypothetical protein F5876DRAFT_80874 [Lentinula aff. lateritia]